MRAKITKQLKIILHSDKATYVKYVRKLTRVADKITPSARA